MHPPPPTLLVSAGHPGQKDKWLSHPDPGSGRAAELRRGGWKRRLRPSAWQVASRGAGGAAGTRGGLLPPGRPRPPRSRGVAPPRRPGRAVPASPPRAATGASGAGSARRRRSAPPGAPSPDPACVPTRTVTPPLRPPPAPFAVAGEGPASPPSPPPPPARRPPARRSARHGRPGAAA